MTLACKEKLEKMVLAGTPLNISMAKKLLFNDLSFKNISDLAHQLDTGCSTISRLASRLGFPSFKHFQVEYHNNLLDRTNSKNSLTSQDTWDKIDFKRIKNGRLFIYTSQNDISLSTFLHSRLSSASIDVTFNSEAHQNTQKEIVEGNYPSTIILIDVFGDSLIIDRVLKAISLRKEAGKSVPQTILFTAASWAFVFNKYRFIHVVELMSEKPKEHFPSWFVYNIYIREVMKVFVDFMNNISV